MENYNVRLNPGLAFIKPYEPGKTIAEAQAVYGEKQFIKLASNENPLGMSPKALATLKARAGEAFAYPEVSCWQLRQKLAGLFQLEPDHFIIGAGGDGVIYSLALTTLSEGAEVIIPQITFPYYEIVAYACRAKVIRSAMRGYHIDLADILSKINEMTRVIWLCNPNNPTGAVITKEELADFLKAVPDAVLVVHDEVYADFAEKAIFPDTIDILKGGRKNIFLIRSFSKIYGLAGVRIGFGIGDPELIRLMYRVRQPFEVSVLAQLAAEAALDDRDFYRQTLTLTATEKAYLYAELERRRLSFVPSSTNFILIETGFQAIKVCEELLKRGIIVRSAHSYHLPTHIRLTIGTHNQNEIFLKALDEVLACLKE